MLAAQNELLVLVDLAMIMAQGHGDYEVGQVTCLHSSVMGYAPLVFELPKERTFDNFIKLCHDVWQNLAADPSLPKKFVRHRDCRLHYLFLVYLGINALNF